VRGMQRIRRLATRVDRNRRRRKIVALSLAVGGLVTAICAAELAATPDDQSAVARTITRQQIRNGRRVAQGGHFDEHQSKALDRQQMTEMAGGYEAEMRKVQEHAEEVRVAAYRSRDIIRMTCIDDKLNQIRSVIQIVEPRFVSIHLVQHDELTLRGQFSQIQQAAEHVRALSADVEMCLGDTLDMVSAGRINEEAPTTVVTDPTRPADPGSIIDRPPEASTYQ
jgi:hypothetical protein